MYLIGDSIFQVSPYLFCWIEFGSIRWYKNELNIRWYLQSFAFVKSAIIEEYDFKLLRVLPAEFIKVELETICITFRQLQSKLSSCYGGEGAEQIKVLKLMLVGNQRLDAFCRQYSPLYGQKAKAAFILEIYVKAIEYT